MRIERLIFTKREISLRNSEDSAVLKKFSLLKSAEDQMSMVTPTTLLACVLNPSEKKVLYNSSGTPRVFGQEYTEIKQSFSNLDKKVMKGLKKTSPACKYYEFVNKAQFNWDNKNSHNAIHYAQMACDHATKKQVNPLFLKMYLFP